MAHRGGLKNWHIDAKWPHQVAVPEEDCVGKRYEKIRAFCSDLSISPRGRSVVIVGPGSHVAVCQVFCFSDRADALKFRAEYGGHLFNPAKDRGKGKLRDRWFRD